MNYTIIPPCEELKDYVSHFWMGRLNRIEQADFTYYSTASTLTEIAFAFKPLHPGGLELLFSSVHGHRENFGQLPAAGFVEILGASLYSYSVPSLLGVSTSDLTNHFVETDTLLGAQSEAIIAKMSTATSLADRISSLADYFKSQLRKKCFKDPVIFSAIKHIRKHYREININTLASACCLSEKQFERRFSAYSGFKPKLYSRITRFEEASWNCRNYDTLTAAAHAHGYYDQAHFIHDFKMFAGFSPKKFFSVVGY
jgi:AraC-like DNA-binding protein